jgi:exonuclease-1
MNDVFLCKNPSFINWSHQMFLHMCILCGCDFLDSLPGVGPKKAHTLIKKYRDIDKVLVALRSELAMKMPPVHLSHPPPLYSSLHSPVFPLFFVYHSQLWQDFENDFRKAELTFLHQRVWDPAKEVRFIYIFFNILYFFIFYFFIFLFF